jgi:hypothetical protein
VVDNQVILQDGSDGRWLHFERPAAVIEAYHLADVRLP